MKVKRSHGAALRRSCAQARLGVLAVNAWNILVMGMAGLGTNWTKRKRDSDRPTWCRQAVLQEDAPASGIGHNLGEKKAPEGALKSVATRGW
jgi:hypothetical protein